MKHTIASVNTADPLILQSPKFQRRMTGSMPQLQRTDGTLHTPRVGFGVTTVNVVRAMIAKVLISGLCRG